MSEPKPRSVMLCRRKTLSVSAEVDGYLEIAGYDAGPPGQSGAGYEYFLTVDAEDIPKVVAALGGQPDDDVLDLLEAHGEEIVTIGEQKWLQSLGIKPSFHSISSFD